MNRIKRRSTWIVLAGMLAWGLSGCGAGSQDHLPVAIELIENFEYEEVLTTLDEALANGEDKRQIARTRGIALAGLMRYEEAVASYVEALSYSSMFASQMDYDINYYLADAYDKMGERQKAISVYSDILALMPDEMNAHFLRGRLYLLDGEFEKALTDFNRTVELEKNGYDLRIEIAGLLTEAGYKDEGLHYLQRFLADNEKKLNDYDKGRIYYYMGDYENAKLALEKAKGNENERIILLLGKSYERLGDYNYATSVYKNYLVDHPEAAEIFNQLGLCKLKSGEYEEALSAFKSAGNAGNTAMERTVEFNLITAYEYTGDFKQAAVLMEAYLKKYPDDEVALREYEFLKTR